MYYTHQVKKTIQEIKNLQNILLASYITLYGLEVCLQGADECIQRWEETLTSTIAIVDQLNEVTHPMLYLQRIKKDALSMTFNIVLEFIPRKETDLI